MRHHDARAALASLRAQLPSPSPSDWHSRATTLLHRLRALEPAPDLVAERATGSAINGLNRAAGMLALSVLLDSAVEHYRGSFKNRAMYTPLVISTLSLGVCAQALTDRGRRENRLRVAAHVLAGLTGIVGTGFHVYNVWKRPGRFAWQNLFYGAPLGAPAAIALSGILGAASERLRVPGKPRLFGLPAGRALAALGGLGMLGSTAEAALLHFRGAFQNPAMFIPVTIPPVASAMLLQAAMSPRRLHDGLARFWMRFTAVIGIAGVGFHAWGVQRMMGGWRNWKQNAVDGPPLPAPPAFTGLAIAGLAALRLLRDHPDA